MLGTHRDRGQSTIRPSSVRAFTLPPAKPGVDMESVMIHGTSIIGSSLQATSRDFSGCHLSQADRSKEVRRSWSARSCPDPVDPESLSRLGPLKVTGVRVSGESGKAGGTGGKVSTFRLNRIRNDLAGSEAADCSSGRQADENCGFQFKVDRDGGSDHLEVVVEQHTPGRSADFENLDHGSEEEGEVSVAAEELLDDGDKALEQLFGLQKDIQLPEMKELNQLEENSFVKETVDIDSFEKDSKGKWHSEDRRIETEGGAPERPSKEDGVLFFITEENSGDAGKDSGGYHGNGKEAEQRNSDNDDLDSMKDSAT